MEHALENARIEALKKARMTPRKKTPSLRKSIDAKCKDCTYDDSNGLGTWRQQTELCTVTRCPLWPVRPVSKASNKDSTLESTNQPGDSNGI